MFKAAAILSLVAVAVSAGITPDLTTMSGAAKGGSGSGTVHGSDGPLAMCDDIPYPTSTKSEQYTCLVQNDSQAASGVAPSRNITASPADGLTCTQSVIAPSLGDAQTLCNNFVPAGQFGVAAAPASNVCTCVQFSLPNSAPSAWFRACNCDFCSDVIFFNIKGDCQTIASSCVAHGVGGYSTTTAPNTYDILFLANSQPPIPVGNNC